MINSIPVNMVSSESYKFLESFDNISNTFRFKIMLKKVERPILMETFLRYRECLHFCYYKNYVKILVRSEFNEEIFLYIYNPEILM